MNQYVCEHGHAYYDGDQGVGNPYDDGDHDGLEGHGHADTSDWEPWERAEYDRGFEVGTQAS